MPNKDEQIKIEFDALRQKYSPHGAIGIVELADELNVSTSWIKKRTAPKCTECLKGIPPFQKNGGIRFPLLQVAIFKVASIIQTL
jgi:hypothetical protein